MAFLEEASIVPWGIFSAGRAFSIVEMRSIEGGSGVEEALESGSPLASLSLNHSSSMSRRLYIMVGLPSGSMTAIGLSQAESKG